jgi:uncharacterized protein
LAKLIVLIVIFAAAWWLLRRHLRALIAKGRADPAPPPAAAEAMVRCERCGVHLPRGECISRDNLFFCSEEHSRLNG